MRCLSCNQLLTTEEDARKSIITGDRIQMCNPCIEPILPELAHSIPIDDPDYEDWYGEEPSEDEEYDDEEID